MSEPVQKRGTLFAGGLAAMLASACRLGPLVLVRVTGTEVAFEARRAKVTLDDTKTGLLAPTTATANAGYPSSVKH